MLPVFAFAAALCLFAFVWANKASAEDAADGLAAVQAQSAAELLKACSGDMEEAAESFGGTWNGKVWTVCYDEQWVRDAGERYVMTAEFTEETIDNFASANICVYQDDDCLIRLDVAWQEDGYE